MLGFSTLVMMLVCIVVGGCMAVCYSNFRQEKYSRKWNRLFRKCKKISYGIPKRVVHVTCSSELFRNSHYPMVIDGVIYCPNSRWDIGYHCNERYIHLHAENGDKLMVEFGWDHVLPTFYLTGESWGGNMRIKNPCVGFVVEIY